MACAALERMIGTEGLHDAVDLIVDGGTGYEIAESVLVHIRSAEATRYAYSIYRASTGQRAADAARVIKQIAHPLALRWVDELLAHPTAAGWGMGLLDQLLWRNEIDAEDAEVERLLRLAEQHDWSMIREQAAFVRGYLRERDVAGERLPDAPPG